MENNESMKKTVKWKTLRYQEKLKLSIITINVTE